MLKTKKRCTRNGIVKNVYIFVYLGKKSSFSQTHVGGIHKQILDFDITNMRKTFTTLFLLCTILSFAQAQKLLDILPVRDGKVTYTGEVQVDSTDKAKLLVRAKKWFVDNLSAKAVNQLDDKENEGVVSLAYIQTRWHQTFMHTPTNVELWHTMKVFVEDNKFGYEITDFRMRYYSAPVGGFGNTTYPINSPGGVVDQSLELISGGNKKSAKKYYTQVDASVNLIIASLNHSMKTSDKD